MRTPIDIRANPFPTPAEVAAHARLGGRWIVLYVVDPGSPAVASVVRLEVDERGRVMSDQMSVGRPIAAVPFW